MFKFKLFFLSLCLLFSPSLYAKNKKLFKASYVSFYIEGDWTCKNFYVEWLCHHRFSDSNFSAFILIGAEEAHSSEYLSKFSNLIRDLPQKIFSLENFFPKKRKVYGFDWIEDFRKNQFPLQGYHQLEASTICCKKGPETARISIMFLAHPEKYSQYSAIFSNAIMSLIIAQNITKLVQDIRQYGSHNPEVVDYIQKILSEEWEEKEISPLEGWSKWKLLLIDLLKNKNLQLIVFCLVSVFVLYQTLFKRKRKRKLRRRRIKRRSQRIKQGENREQHRGQHREEQSREARRLRKSNK